MSVLTYCSDPDKCKYHNLPFTGVCINYTELDNTECNTSPEVVYISGPMRGIDEYNYPAFDAAARYLRASGYEVLNPAENFSGDTTLKFETYMATDLGQVLRSDYVAVLSGWSNSEGARLEVQVAQATGKPVVWADNFRALTFEELHTPEQEAWKLVHGERGRAYGHPLDNFTRLGRMWGALLDLPDIPPATVALMHVLGKLAREANAEKRDNVTDSHGYLNTYTDTLKEQARRASE